MKLAFIWYWNRASEIMPNWRDGLRGAIEEIQRQGHTVDWFLNEEIPSPVSNDFYDFILVWGDSNCPLFNWLHEYKAKKGIILTTDPTNIENLRKVDIVFCESQPVFEACRNLGLNAVKAFGTDTDFYTPDTSVKKDIEYFYPATFSPWKRQHDVAYLGPKLLCVGTVQPDGQEDLKACKKAGVQVEIGYFPAEQIRDYYRRTKNVIIPAVHGSERTVLESMSVNILPIVTNPMNQRALSYVDEYLREKEKYNGPRHFVVDKYNHRLYAEKIMEAFNEN